MTGALSECPPSASLGNGAFGSGLDLTIYYHVCVRWVRARVDYIVMCLPCDVLIRFRVGVSYIYNVHVIYSAGYFAQHKRETFAANNPFLLHVVVHVLEGVKAKVPSPQFILNFG